MIRTYPAVLLLLLLFLGSGLVHSEGQDKHKNEDTVGVGKCKDNSGQERSRNGVENGVQEEVSGRMTEDHNVSLVEEGRKRGGSQNGGKQGGNQQQKGIMERILPMMIMPFMISTGMIPMMLVSLKIMMLKSALIGKIAIILILINMFRNRSNRGGVFNHNIMGLNGDGGGQSHDKNDWIMQEHYGYQGEAEYGAYISKRRRRRKRNITND